MQARSWYWLLFGPVLAVWIVLSARNVEARRVPCDAVIAEAHHERRSINQTSVDISKLSKTLGTTVAWTEHCMRAYGRRPKRPGLESAESREEELESFEEDEPEETFPEDADEEGVPDLKDQPEKQRILKIHPSEESPDQELREGFER